MIWLADANQPLPETHLALGPDSEAPGLLAAGGELTPQRLTEAYRKGVFPWYSQGEPVLWWSPEPRMVLLTQEFKVSRSFKKTLRQFQKTPGCEVRIDSAFERVIKACAHNPRRAHCGTWIVPEMVQAYSNWHALGHAHSVETWIDGELAGGLYGVSQGAMFFGESMFAYRTDASKIALAALVCFCREHHMPMLDCQQQTEHLASMGGRTLERAEFELLLARNVRQAGPTNWSYAWRLWQHLEAPTS
jgi:leucyl/phenylalanyl-tRNA---protein transferase